MVGGQYVSAREDVALPGVLALVLRRAYASGHVGGRLFGPGFSSTLDMRVQLDGEEIRFADDDCRVLVFPRPAPDGQPVISPAGPQLTLTVHEDDRGPVIRVHDRLGRRDFEFAGPDAEAFAVPSGSVVLPLVAVTDPAGNQFEIRRAAGVPVEVRHSGGYRIRVECEQQAFGGERVIGLRLLSEADAGPGQPLMSFEYDDLGRLAGYTDGSGVPFLYEWDAHDRICAWTDRTGHQFRYRYDADGRVSATEGDGGYLSGFFEYRPEQRETVYSDSLGARTLHRYDAQGRVIEVIDPLGNVTRTGYDEFGQIASVTDPLGHTTTLHRDEHGDLVGIDHPGGGASSFEYSRQGDLLRRTLPSGGVWQYAYDDHGNLAALTDPAGAHSRFGYDDRGMLTAAVDALGARTSYLCDAAGLPIAISDPLGAATQVQRDARGRVVTVTDPLGRISTFAWDHDGRILARTLPDGSRETWQYDAEGNQICHTDPAGGITRLAWGPFRTLSARTDPGGASYRFEHDTELRLTNVTDPLGNTWQYTYDAGGNLSAETDFDGRRLAYDYDAAGRVIRRTNGAGQRVALARDAAGRVTEQRDGEHATTFAYDLNGDLVRADYADGYVALARDQARRVTAETCDGRTLFVAYDAVGQRLSRTTPSGRFSTWQYDAAGRPLRFSAGEGQSWIEFGHDALGRETHRWLSAAVALTSEWDLVDRLTARRLLAVTGQTHETRAARLLEERGWTYRADGIPDSVTDTAAGDRRLTLDTGGRITAVTAATWAEHYAYDALGNVTDAADTRSPDAPTSGPRELTGTLLRRAGRTSYDYDAQGRLIRTTHRTLSGTRRTWTFTYDAHDRMIGAETPDGTRWHYRYDPFGRRTVKQRLNSDGGIAEQIRFVWDGSVPEQEHLGAAGAAVTVTCWDYEPDSWMPLAQDRRTYYAHAPQELIDRQFHAIVTDLVGTPTELVEPGGAIAWRRPFGIWGGDVGSGAAPADTAEQAEPFCPLRFPGQYHDPETGLDYNFGRYYDSSVGRYSTPDPLGLQPAPNHYGYVANPLALTDPLGLAQSSGGGSSDGLKWVDPKTINFSQRTVSANNYADQMRAGTWDWTRPGTALRVVEVNGQLVTYDNRRLDASLEVDAPAVPVTRVDPNAPDGISAAGRTWQQAFTKRLNDPRNVRAGGALPPEGTSERPTCP